MNCEPRLDEIEDPQAKAHAGQGIDGLRTVGEGSEELDQDKSMLRRQPGTRLVREAERSLRH